MQVLGVADLKLALAQLNLDLDVIEFAASTATAQQAADNIGCDLGQIVKSLGFMIDKKRPTLVLASGDQTVDERKLAALFAVGRKKARMMTAEQCIAPFWVTRRVAYRRSGIAAAILRLTSTNRCSAMSWSTRPAARPTRYFPFAWLPCKQVTGGVFADLVK